MKNENYYRSDDKSNEKSKIHSSFFILYSSFLIFDINQSVSIHRHTFALSDDGKMELIEFLEVPLPIRSICLSPVIAVS